MVWEKMIRALVYLKDNWHKYCWLVCIILLVYALIKTFSPNVKTVETVTTVVDTESLKKAESTITQLNTDITTMNSQIDKLKKINKAYQSETIIVEIKYPDGRIEKRTEKRTTSNSIMVVVGSSSSTGTSTNTSISTSTNSSTVEASSHTTTNVSTITERNPIPFWATIFGYQFQNKQCLMGQGINIGDNIMVGVLGSYKFNLDVEDKKWDAGGVAIVRY